MEQDKSIVMNTVGIIFINTPHRGWEVAEKLHTINRLLGRARGKIFKQLLPGSDSLLELTERFKYVLRLNYFPIYTCYASMPEGFVGMVCKNTNGSSLLLMGYS